MYLNLKDKHINSLKKRNEMLEEENKLLIEQLKQYEGIEDSVKKIEDIKFLYEKLLKEVKNEKEEYKRLNRKLDTQIIKMQLKTISPIM